MKKKIVKIEEVRGLGALQCTHREAAGFLGLRIAQFRKLLRTDDRISEAFDDGKMMGLVSLRRKQSDLATNSASMAKWLGKQYLDQREVINTELTGRDGGPIDFDGSQLTIEDRNELRELLTRASKPGSNTR